MNGLEAASLGDGGDPEAGVGEQVDAQRDAALPEIGHRHGAMLRPEAADQVRRGDVGGAGDLIEGERRVVQVGVDEARRVVDGAGSFGPPAFGLPDVAPEGRGGEVREHPGRARERPGGGGHRLSHKGVERGRGRQDLGKSLETVFESGG
jgi:hypothetical protein